MMLTRLAPPQLLYVTVCVGIWFLYFHFSPIFCICIGISPAVSRTQFGFPQQRLDHPPLGLQARGLRCGAVAVERHDCGSVLIKRQSDFHNEAEVDKIHRRIDRRRKGKKLPPLLLQLEELQCLRK